MEQIEAYWAQARETFPLLLTGAMTLSAALAILIIGWIVAKIARGIIRKPSFGGQRLDATLRPVFATTVFYTIVAMTLYAFLTKLGVPAHSLLAVFGAAGLAIAFALKDTLSNIAAGVMMIALRPLQVGDFVDTPNAMGSVTEIGLFSTSIKNVEGVYIFVPNSQVWATRVQNFGRHTERRLMVDIGVSYETDLKKAQAILLETLAALPDVQSLPTPPECYVMTFGDSAITLSSRAWLPADNWLARASDARIALKEALDKAGIEIPFPQRVVTMKK
ncbi:mechanosensitive ion channel family protein [Fretibacter rubidus]|uniref:mechanosensitive ion channel family protein n=1 Tax=Fretibacter rubidus TaxID=570162 RepID=UPI003529F1E8